MQRHDLHALADPPDLLRRFVPTPFKAVYRVENKQIFVESNDNTLLRSLPLEESPADPARPAFEWKLVRDMDSPGPLESPVFFSTKALEIVFMGPACLLALDPERRELLGFIGVDIDACVFEDFLLPLLLRLTKEAAEATPPMDLVQPERGSHR